MVRFFLKIDVMRGNKEFLTESYSMYDDKKTTMLTMQDAIYQKKLGSLVFDVNIHIL